MNREMILRVADAIENAAKPEANPKFGFNMETFGAPTSEVLGGDKTGHNCGTVGCIAGWTVSINGEMTEVPLMSSDVDQEAARILDLAFWEAEALFYADDSLVSRAAIKPSHAASVLRHLANTGEVDWNVSVEARP